MHPYPHSYSVSASGQASGLVRIGSPGLAELATAPPSQFDGPGDQWSPETLLCAAVADCFILTFRALARAARLEWLQLECRVEGTLERVERVAQFTRFATFATLAIATTTDAEQARKLLGQAEHSCLISNSLRGERVLDARVITR
jgi:organic hydroperoxide reductase OsmC/OhrA